MRRSHATLEEDAVPCGLYIMAMRSRPQEYGGHGNWQPWFTAKFCVPNRISYRQATVREVVAVWRRAGR